MKNYPLSFAWLHVYLTWYAPDSFLKQKLKSTQICNVTVQLDQDDDNNNNRLHLKLIIKSKANNAIKYKSYIITTINFNSHLRCHKLNISTSRSKKTIWRRKLALASPKNVINRTPIKIIGHKKRSALPAIYYFDYPCYCYGARLFFS